MIKFELYFDSTLVEYFLKNNKLDELKEKLEKFTIITFRYYLDTLFDNKNVITSRKDYEYIFYSFNHTKPYIFIHEDIIKNANAENLVNYIENLRKDFIKV